jgi:hypothetical protein
VVVVRHWHHGVDRCVLSEAQMMSAPIDFAADNSESRGELILAVNELMQILQRDFLR